MAAAGADIRPLRGRCDRDADLASRIALVSALVQTLVPDWARARVLAVFILTCQGGLAAGSATWGVVATRIGIPATLVIAGLSTLDDCHVRLQEIAGRDRRHHAMEPLAAAGNHGLKDRVNAISLAQTDDFRRDSDLFLECARDPKTQRRIQVAMRRGFQTHDGELALGLMMSELADR